MRLVQPLRQAIQAPWLRDPLWTVARAVPAFDIDASRGELPIDRISGQDLTTFTRAASAMFLDSTGTLQTAGANVLRRQWDATNRRWGWLVEEARTNLALRSQEFNTGWTVTGTSVSANSATAPDGTATADLLTEDASTGNHSILQSISFTSGLTYTFSLYYKVNSGTRNLRAILATNTFVSNPQVTVSSSGAIVASADIISGSASVTALANGWYRLAFSATADATGSSNFFIRLASGTNDSYTGDSASGHFIWGAQVEAGAFPTSYIATTGATATRDADVWTVTGSNFSRWYNQAAGTVYADWLANGDNANATIYNFNAGNFTSNLLEMYRGSVSTLTARIRDGSSSQETVTLSSTWLNTPTKSVAAYETNNLQIAGNGSLGGSDTSLALPTPTSLHIGRDQASASGKFFNGLIYRLTYWPTRLSNSTLQDLTR